MWTFARFLPLVIGHKFSEDDEYWLNFLRLLEITDIVFSREITIDMCGYLKSLISDHHSCFKELYSDVSITMKMHSMIHLPRLTIEYVYMYIIVCLLIFTFLMYFSGMDH